MAMYVPTRTRRRRAVAVAGVALVVGLIIGFAGGRASAPTAQDQIRSIQEDARQTAAGLRVIALHDEAGATTDAGTGDDGAALVLERTGDELDRELDAATWIGAAERTGLLAALDDLTAIEDRSTKEFGDGAEALAAQIDESFGTSSS